MIEQPPNARAARSPAGPPPPIAFDDDALVERSRRGDMQAFGALVLKYQDRIFNLVYRMCGRRCDAEELTQETFLKALERIGQFRGSSRFYTWLFRIAANLTLSHRRRAARVRFHPFGGPEAFDAAQPDAPAARRRDPGPEDIVMAAERDRRVTQAVEELDEMFRLIVILRDVEGMAYTGIADVLELPVGTVKSRLHRARCLLRDRLADVVSGTPPRQWSDPSAVLRPS